MPSFPEHLPAVGARVLDRLQETLHPLPAAPSPSLTELPATQPARSISAPPGLPAKVGSGKDTFPVEYKSVPIVASGTDTNIKVFAFQLGPKDGKNILLGGHAFPLDSSMWLPVAQKLAAKGYRVTGYDMPGAGRSERVPATAFKNGKVSGYSGDNVAADEHQVVNSLLGESAPFARVSWDWGHVIGGFVADRPQYAERMVALLGGGGGHPANYGFGEFLAHDPSQLLKSYYIPLIEKTPAVAAKMFAKDDFKALKKIFTVAGVDPSTIDQIIQPFREDPTELPERLKMYVAASKFRKPAGEYSKIGALVGDIVGKNDPVTGKWLGQSMGAAGHASSSVTAELPGGHWGFLTDPDAFVAQIDAWAQRGFANRDLLERNGDGFNAAPPAR